MFDLLTRPFKYQPIDWRASEPATKGKKKERAKDWSGTLSRLWSYLAVYKGKLFLVVLMVVASSVLSLLGPFLVGVSIDRFIVTNELNGLTTLLVFLFIIYIGHSVSIWLQNYWMVEVAQKSVYEIRMHLFTHLQKLPIPFFDKRQHGELMSRVTNDMENVSSTLNSSVIQILSSVLTFIGILGVMIYLSPLMTVLTLLIIPVMVLGLKWITRRTSVFFKEQQRNIGDVNGFIEETVSGQSMVKVFSQEERVIGEFEEKNQKLKQSGFWAQTYSGFIPKVMNVLNNLSFAVIAGVGGVLVLQDAITIGVIVIFAEYARQFTRPLNDLANQFNTLLSAVAGAERVFQIIDEPVEKDQKDSLPVPQFKGNVDFRNVSFSYEKDEKIIDDINFTVKSGETAAFVGPTGAGKTTIINMISRFYNPDSGEILFDGEQVNRYDREEVRRQLGYVLQDPFLFEGTIRENIRYGRLSATDDEVEQAAKEANAHSFISHLEEQYDTILSQDGGGISQGQKQLISIARALLADPSILILDEATSSIDTVTELKIQEALFRLMRGRTSFVIAHRLNTIEKADKIFVLVDGKIIEQGTHEELRHQRGYYQKLYEGD
ncbi:Multi-drug ABC transporter ATP-binding protein and permease [Alkalihalophilus pseudofirmus OF4]|uniref:Multi-drug ABC transporter ATP-binding protein and permease n=1 Tax=Alkalihalophilus pseudofirmus (strain ATCC BAA-2126 / JCM 17055 / OF4) TaxID=398511 RepID=D3FTN8_ALKPO|nr:ABC transporter ATP-binding protein [Alkalihalophilus pseudofirmus]ADC50111.1 Multi-drug ABC transporter ATP-binding protein and permease [Alkalihalophilus pseudofirmus OF4]